MVGTAKCIRLLGYSKSISSYFTLYLDMDTRSDIRSGYGIVWRYKPQKETLLVRLKLLTEGRPLPPEAPWALDSRE